MGPIRAIDFDRVWRCGTKYVGKYTIVYVAHIEEDNQQPRARASRMGCIVTKKSRNSVVRNKIKRWYRNIFHNLKKELPENLSMIWIARSGANEAGYHRIDEDLRTIFKERDCDAKRKTHRTGD